jgi:Predicted amidophosphoribosyltransferases
MRPFISRRDFLERAAYAGVMLAMARPAFAAADGMFVSLNGSVTRGVTWPDRARLAAKLGLRYVPVVAKVRECAPQAEMSNTAQQAANVAGAFAVTVAVPDGPVLLVDDVIDSRWTVTTIGALLREAGSGPVFPISLARRSGE